MRVLAMLLSIVQVCIFPLFERIEWTDRTANGSRNKATTNRCSAAAMGCSAGTAAIATFRTDGGSVLENATEHRGLRQGYQDTSLLCAAN